MIHTTPLPISHSKVLIIGNRSYKNLGDELILVGTIKLLLEQHNSLVIQAYDPKRLGGFLKQFVAMDRITLVTEIPKGARSMMRYIGTGKIRERATLWSCDQVIVGGGEILTEENSNSYSYWLVSLVPSLMRKLFAKTEIHLMGGIQIPQKKQNTILFDFLLKQCSSIWARDEESVKELTKYGYKSASFFMDTAFYSYTWPKYTGKSDKSIIINLNKHGAHFIDTLIEDMKNYVDQDYTIHYVPVSKGGQSDYNDVEYLDLIQAAYPTAKINILDWESDFATFVDKISKASLVISSRLHLFLIASFMGVKTKVYPYQKKIIKMQSVIKKHFR
ncbi:MAG: polysaccharide pyruvyl transferase family protein [Candidatus Absconditabacteria bacterium]